MLVAFDFDGTLSDSEMTVLLGEEKGLSREIREITEKAMNDEISYADSLRERVNLLEGLSVQEVRTALEKVELRSGAPELLKELGKTDHHIAILTGGFERGVDNALHKSGTSVHSVIANRLIFRDGELTGEVQGPLIEDGKDTALKRLAEQKKLELKDAIAVGDGANDIPMLRIAGYSVGYEPKPAVETHCDASVSSIEELRTVFQRRNIL